MTGMFKVYMLINRYPENVCFLFELVAEVRKEIKIHPL